MFIVLGLIGLVVFSFVCMFYLFAHSPVTSSNLQRTTIKEQEAIMKGVKGEADITRFIESLKGNYLVLQNLYLPKKNGELTEIDAVVIHSSGIHVIESKNYSGWIYGAEQDFQWTQKFPNGTAQTFYNPIQQNETHIKAFKGQFTYLDPSMIHSWVVFSDRSQLKKVEVTSPHVYVKQLNEFKQDFQRLTEQLPVVFSPESLSLIYQHFLKFQATEEKKVLHLQQVEQIKQRQAHHRRKPVFRADRRTTHRSNGFFKGIIVLVGLYFIMSALTQTSTNFSSNFTNTNLSTTTTSTNVEMSFLQSVNYELASKINKTSQQRISEKEARQLIERILERNGFQGFKSNVTSTFDYGNELVTSYTYNRYKGKNVSPESLKVQVKWDQKGVKSILFTNQP